MSKVWVTGDAVVDLIPNDEQTYLKCPGGAPANVAVAVSRLNGDSGFFGRVGNDPFGRFLKATLDNENVDVRFMQLDKERRTSTVIVDLDDTGERSFTFMVKPSADQFFTAQDIPPFRAGQWLHCCSIALANEPSRSATFEAIDRIKQAGGFFSFDPNLREEVWSNQSEIRPTVLNAISKADVIKFSDDELMFLTQTNSLAAGLDALQAPPHQLVVITQGAKGALVIFENRQIRIAATKVTPVDTTGAGDAFVGGMLARLAQADDWHNWPLIESAIKWANGCGALATTRKGAMSALPEQDELNALVPN